MILSLSAFIKEEILANVCYSPTNTSDDIVAEEFYSGLSTLIKQVPKHNVTIVGGDMNVKIGKENCKGTPYHETTNLNGQLLLDVINVCNIVNLNKVLQTNR